MSPLDNFFEAWSESDREQRLRLVHSAIARDGTYADPMTSEPLAGPDAAATWRDGERANEVQLGEFAELHPKDRPTMHATTELSSWLHAMAHLPVTDMDRSIAYYEEILGFRLAWRTADGSLAALASGDVELFLLATRTATASRWDEARSAYARWRALSVRVG